MLCDMSAAPGTIQPPPQQQQPSGLSALFGPPQQPDIQTPAEAAFMATRPLELPAPVRLGLELQRRGQQVPPQLQVLLGEYQRRGITGTGDVTPDTAIMLAQQRLQQIEDRNEHEGSDEGRERYLREGVQSWYERQQAAYVQSAAYQNWWREQPIAIRMSQPQTFGALPYAERSRINQSLYEASQRERERLGQQYDQLHTPQAEYLEQRDTAGAMLIQSYRQANPNATDAELYDYMHTELARQGYQHPNASQNVLVDRDALAEQIRQIQMNANSTMFSRGVHDVRGSVPFVGDLLAGASGTPVRAVGEIAAMAAFYTEAALGLDSGPNSGSATLSQGTDRLLQNLGLDRGNPAEVASGRRFAFDVGTAVGDIALIIATRNPAAQSRMAAVMPGMVYFGGREAGQMSRQAYDSYVRQGMDPRGAQLMAGSLGIAAGTMTALLERIPLDTYFDPAKRTLFNRALQGMIREGTTEAAQELSNVALLVGADVQDMTFMQALGRVMYAGAVGAVAGGAMNSIIRPNQRIDTIENAERGDPRSRMLLALDDAYQGIRQRFAGLFNRRGDFVDVDTEGSATVSTESTSGTDARPDEGGRVTGRSDPKVLPNARSAASWYSKTYPDDAGGAAIESAVQELGNGERLVLTDVPVAGLETMTNGGADLDTTKVQEISELDAAAQADMPPIIVLTDPSGTPIVLDGTHRVEGVKASSPTATIKAYVPESMAKAMAAEAETAAAGVGTEAEGFGVPGGARPDGEAGPDVSPGGEAAGVGGTGTDAAVEAYVNRARDHYTGERGRKVGPREAAQIADNLRTNVSQEAGDAYMAEYNRLRNEAVRARMGEGQASQASEADPELTQMREKLADYEQRLEADKTAEGDDKMVPRTREIIEAEVARLREAIRQREGGEAATKPSETDQQEQQDDEPIDLTDLREMAPRAAIKLARERGRVIPDGDPLGPGKHTVAINDLTPGSVTTGVKISSERVMYWQNAAHRLSQPPIVNEEADGALIVTDGNHRLIAAALLGDTSIEIRVVKSEKAPVGERGRDRPAKEGTQTDRGSETNRQREGEALIEGAERTLAQLKASIDELTRQARSNPLTGGLNRAEFDRLVELAQAEADQTGQPFSIIAFDAANLKSVNDTQGDAAGDAYLKETYEAIANVTREGVTTDRTRADAFHYGGDEFAILLTGLPAENAAEVAESIRDRAEAAMPVREVVPGVSSFLVGEQAVYEPNTGSTADVLAQATDGMKARKKRLKAERGEATTREGAEAAQREAQQGTEGTIDLRGVENIEQSLDQLKQQYGSEALAVFNMGDGEYRLIGQDARDAAKITGIEITKGDQGLDELVLNDDNLPRVLRNLIQADRKPLILDRNAEAMEQAEQDDDPVVDSEQVARDAGYDGETDIDGPVDGTAYGAMLRAGVETAEDLNDAIETIRATYDRLSFQMPEGADSRTRYDRMNAALAALTRLPNTNENGVVENPETIQVMPRGKNGDELEIRLAETSDGYWTSAMSSSIGMSGSSGPVSRTGPFYATRGEAITAQLDRLEQTAQSIVDRASSASDVTRAKKALRAIAGRRAQNDDATLGSEARPSEYFDQLEGMSRSDLTEAEDRDAALAQRVGAKYVVNEYATMQRTVAQNRGAVQKLNEQLPEADRERPGKKARDLKLQVIRMREKLVAARVAEDADVPAEVFQRYPWLQPQEPTNERTPPQDAPEPTGQDEDQAGAQEGREDQAGDAAEAEARTDDADAAERAVVENAQREPDIDDGEGGRAWFYPEDSAKKAEIKAKAETRERIRDQWGADKKLPGERAAVAAIKKRSRPGTPKPPKKAKTLNAALARINKWSATEQNEAKSGNREPSIGGALVEGVAYVGSGKTFIAIEGDGLPAKLPGIAWQADKTMIDGTLTQAPDAFKQLRTLARGIKHDIEVGNIRGELDRLYRHAKQAQSIESGTEKRRLAGVVVQNPDGTLGIVSHVEGVLAELNVQEGYSELATVNLDALLRVLDGMLTLGVTNMRVGKSSGGRMGMLGFEGNTPEGQRVNALVVDQARSQAKGTPRTVQQQRAEFDDDAEQRRQQAERSQPRTPTVQPGQAIRTGEQDTFPLYTGYPEAMRQRGYEPIRPDDGFVQTEDAVENAIEAENNGMQVALLKPPTGEGLMAWSRKPTAPVSSSPTTNLPGSDFDADGKVEPDPDIDTPPVVPLPAAWGANDVDPARRPEGDFARDRKKDSPKGVRESIKAARERAKRDTAAVHAADNIYSIIEDISRRLGAGQPGVGRRPQLGKSASGFIESWTEAIRLEKGGYVATQIHELGHLLHKLLFAPRGARVDLKSSQLDHLPRDIRDELLQLGKDLYGKRKPAAGYKAEGWAEAIRMLVTEPTTLRSKAPKTYQLVTMKLKTEHPETWYAILDARVRLRNAIRLAEVDPVDQFIAHDDTSKKRPNIRSWYDDLRIRLFDRFHRLVTMKQDLGLEDLPAHQDPHTLALRANGHISGDIKLAMNAGTFKPSDGARRRTGKSLVEILEPVRNNLRLWQNYMVARRALEKREQGYTTLPQDPRLPDMTSNAKLEEYIRRVEAEYPFFGDYFRDRGGERHRRDADGEYMYDESGNPVMEGVEDNTTVASQFQAFNRWLIEDYAVYYGLVSPEAAELIVDRNLEYITFRYKQTHDALGQKYGANSSAGGFVNTGSGIRRFKQGKGEQLFPPLEAFMASMQGIMGRARLNEVGRSVVNVHRRGHAGAGRWLNKISRPSEAMKVNAEMLRGEVGKQLGIAVTDAGEVVLPPYLDGLTDAQLGELIDSVEAMTGATFWRAGNKTDRDNREISVLINGKPEFYEVKDARLFDMLEGLGSPGAAHAMLRFFGFPSRVLRAGATQLNVSFSIPNFVRDITQALTMTDTELRNVPQQTRLRLQGMREAFMGGDLANLFLASGADMSGIFSEFYDPTSKKIDFDKMFEKSKYGFVKGDSNKRIAADLIKLGPISRLNGAMEKAVRMGEFAVVYQEMRDAGKSEREAVAAAGQAAADITLDFQRGGSWSKQINEIVVFFNAAMLGADKLGRYIKKNPWKAAGRIFAFTIMPSILSMALNWDNEDYWAKPQRMRDRYWYFPTGRDSRGRQTYIRLPKPYGLGAFSIVVERTFARMFGIDPATGERGDQDAFDGMGWAIISEFRPAINFAGILPLYEVNAGERGFSFYRDQEIVSQADSDLPYGMQGATRSSEMARVLGAWLDYPPAKIDYLVSGFFGGLGRDTVATVIDPVISAVDPEARQGEPMEFSDYLVVRRFIAGETQGGHEAVTRFFNEYEDLQRVNQGARALEDRPERYDAYVREHAVELDLWQEYSAAYSEMTGAFSELRALYRQRGEIPSDQFEQQVDELYDRIIDRAQEAHIIGDQMREAAED